MSKAKLVLTDSGGLQEETTSSRIPALHLERILNVRLTADEGTNTIVGCILH